MARGSERREPACLMAPAEALEKFHGYLKSRGLKLTRQRERIARVVLGSRTHRSVETIYNLCKLATASLGQVTVYRTLRMLVEAGLVAERDFGQGRRMYEPMVDHAHHGHFVCNRCGGILEFTSPRIEAELAAAADEIRFETESRTIQVYGVCDRCVKVSPPSG